MKQRFILLCAVILLSVTYIGAVPASPESFNVTQPDGSVITLHMMGDEYYHWIETLDNDIVILSEDGFYEYATIKGGDIVPSGIKVVNGYNQKTDEVNVISSKHEIANLIMSKHEAIVANMDSLSFSENSLITNSQTPLKASSNISLTDGNQKVLCILMGFPDKPFTKSKSDFENMWNQTGYSEEGSFGSVKDFYLENSYGHMNVTATVIGPYIAKKNSSYYATGNNISGSKVRELVKEALTAAKSDIKFKNFDVNGDKYVDAVHIVFAGYACDANPSRTDLIWSHHWSLSSAVSQSGYKAKQYFITSELAGGSGTKIAPVGTICHEYGHQLGAPDYYSNVSYTGTGSWDVMGSGSWNYSGRCPAHHNPYTKAYIYNWVTPMIINSSASNVTYTLTPSHNTTSIYRINTSTNNEFYLLENKKSVSNTFNYWVPGSGGLLIYHIHSDIANAISNHNVNNSHPQKCYIVCANASSNPNSSASSYGSTGIECAYPYNGKIFFTSNSTPSATSWAGVATDVNMCFIQRSGDNIKFVVNPQIQGPSTLSSQSSYYVSNVPAGAKIKWTYTFTPNSVFQRHQLGKPIIFVNGDSTSYVTIKRGKYLAVKADTLGPIIPRDSMIIKPLNTMLTESESTNSEITYVYFTGTAVLKATITSGGDSYTITKTISLSSTTTATIAQEENEDIDENIVEKFEDTTVDYFFEESTLENYRLVYTNPIIDGTANIQVEILDNGAYIPYQGSYNLSIWSDKLGLIQNVTSTFSNLSIDCYQLPKGIYQLILQVDGKIVANGKMLNY